MRPQYGRQCGYPNYTGQTASLGRTEEESPHCSSRVFLLVPNEAQICTGRAGCFRVSLLKEGVMEVTGGFGFARDDETAALARKVTALKDAGDWNGAISTLREFKEKMWVSPVNFGVDAWCRLPLILQQAGRFEESELEFEKLLDELPRLARKYSFIDEPEIFVGEPGKKAMYQQTLKIYKKLIKERRELSRTREARKLTRQAKIDAKSHT
jgi:tetratricopeptide (TPR) repeat protein